MIGELHRLRIPLEPLAGKLHADDPEQRDLDYLFDDMDRPTTFSFRKNSGYRNLASAQEFSGPAVKSLYAEADRPGPTQIAQAR